MNLKTALELGRVSNLPTVWSNVLAGIVLAGATPRPLSVVMLGAAASLMYVGGMYLNDVFDADIDAQERPDRPIPSGRVTRSAVRNLGFLALVLGAGLVGTHAGMVGAGMPPVIAAIATVGTIVIYDAWHKGNPVAPAIMGLCRVGVYAMAALSVAPTLGPDVLYGAGLLLAYVVGLTYVAAHENKSGLGRTWPLVCLYAPIVYSLPLLSVV